MITSSGSPGRSAATNAATTGFFSRASSSGTTIDSGAMSVLICTGEPPAPARGIGRTSSADRNRSGAWNRGDGTLAQAVRAMPPRRGRLLSWRSGAISTTSTS